MIERDPRLDAHFKQSIDQSIVERESRLVDLTAAARQDAGPCDREAIGVDAQLLHDPDIRQPSMVVVAGDIARIAIVRFARCMAESIPDRLATAIGPRGTLDLIGCR